MGHEGGMLAEKLDSWEDWRAALTANEQGAPLGWEEGRQAERDVRRLAAVLARAPKRRATPSWSPPGGAAAHDPQSQQERLHQGLWHRSGA